MSQINFNGAFATEKIGEFGGICRSACGNGKRRPLGLKNARDCVNFRILPSGALEKREGFKHVFSLPEEPRAFVSDFFCGSQIAAVLIGDTVTIYDIPLKKDDAGRVIGRVASSEGRAEMFFFDEMLFVLDGSELYCYDGYDLMPVHGYVPLYGKGWDGSSNVAINEPLNLLSNMIRIHYRVSGGATNFYVGLKCKSIVSVKKNVHHDVTSEMKLTSDGCGFYMSGGSAVGENDYDVILRLDDSVINRGAVTHCTHAVAYGGELDGRLLFYGGDRASVVYSSCEVSYSAYNSSMMADPASIALYFPVTGAVSVSYGRHPVTSVCRYYDRLLIFTEGETWMADFTSEKNIIKPVNSSVGCRSERGAVLGGAIPYSVGADGIYKWSSHIDKLDECSAEQISGGINGLLDDGFFSRAVAVYFRARDEVWFADPESSEQNVFIYSPTNDSWFRFDSVPVDIFFEYGDNIAMLYGKHVFAFSVGELLDTGIDGGASSMIYASYETNSDDFGHPERLKHLKRMLIKADSGGEPLRITVKSDNGGYQRITVGEDATAVSPEKRYFTHIEAHTDIGRFNEMSCSVVCGGIGRARIDMLAFSASK